jgi:MoxR-like ATPase
MYVEFYSRRRQLKQIITSKLYPWALLIITSLRAAELTYTETTEQNMLALALAVSQGHPILLEGITGAGKTALIDHLAYETGNTGNTIYVTFIYF